MPCLAYSASPPISVLVKVLLIVSFPKASSNWYKPKKRNNNNNFLAHITSWLDQRLRDAIRKLFVHVFFPPVRWLLSPTGAPLVKQMARGSSSSRLTHSTSLAPQQERAFFLGGGGLFIRWLLLCYRKEQSLFLVASTINSGLPLFLGEPHRPGELTAMTILTCSGGRGSSTGLTKTT